MKGEETVEIRAAVASDAAAVAAIWCAGWHDGHAGRVPDELAAVRTPESFAERAAERVSDTTVALVDGEPAGFVMVVRDEVEQVYVGAQHRGTGVAGRLLHEAERQVRANGYGEAWLAVVELNRRARAFYEREGWVDRGEFEYEAQSAKGPITVRALRYVKAMQPGGQAGVR